MEVRCKKNDIGIYLGSPDNIINGGWIYYPYTKQILARANITEARIPEDAFKEYYARRYELKNQSPASTIGELFENISAAVDVGDQTVNFTVAFDDLAGEPTDDDNSISSSDSTVISDNRSSSLHLPPTLTTVEETDDYPVAKDMTIPSEVIVALQKNFNLKLEDIMHALSGKKRTGKRKHRRNKIFVSPSDRITRSMNKNHTVMANAASVPRLRVKDALNSADRDKWIDALKCEIHSLLSVTKTLVPEAIDMNSSYDLIHSTMNLKKKMKDISTIDKYKARCCACGNELTAKGTYDNETFSPTASFLAHSALLQLAVHDRMHMSTFDTVAAYPYQEYPQSLKPLYIKLPKLVAEACGLNPNITYRVKKYLYGLPDAGRAYYIAYTDHLIQAGYSSTASDPCLFTKSDPQRNMRTYVWFHVDDTFVASTHPEEIANFKDCLADKFKITTNPEVSGHLGVNYEHLPSGAIKLSQEKLLGEIFNEYPPRKYDSSCPQRISSRDKELINSEPVDQGEYLHLLGMLMYMTHSRPDISTALSYASTKNVNPMLGDFNALLDVVDYLASTSNIGLTIHPSSGKHSPLKLICHVDASYLAHEDAHSHSGYCLSFGSIGIFFAKSQKQKLVATSSTHAEIRALYTLVLDIIYVVNLCAEIGRPVDLPAIVFEDNQPVIDLSKTLHGKINRSKHFLMLVHFIREQVTEGLLELRKIATSENTADILTKAVVGQAFKVKALRLLGAIGFIVDGKDCSE